MNTFFIRPVDMRPLDDIEARAAEVDDGRPCDRIEFATFTEGEYVESVIVTRARALAFHRELGQLLAVTPDGPEQREFEREEQAERSRSDIERREQEADELEDAEIDVMTPADFAAAWMMEGATP